MAKKSAVNKTIYVLPGRTLDPNSAKRARHRSRRYTAATVFWMLTLLPGLFAIVYGRMKGTLNFRAGAFLLISFCALLVFYGYFGTKRQVYTGRCGFEQLDSNGSPFIGLLVSKKGHIRPINLLLLFCMFIIISGISLRYLSLYPSENQLTGNLLQNLIGSLRSLGFLFSLLLGFSGMTAVLVYGMPRFWDRLKVFLRGSLLPFLLLQLFFLLISAVLFYLLSRLSTNNADADAVVQSLGNRILGTAYDTGNPAQMLFGSTDSVLASLSAASLYASLFDTIIDRFDEGPETFKEQLKSMMKDSGTLLTSLMMLLSIMYVGVSNFMSLPKVLSWVIRIVILAAWGYSAYRSFADTKTTRWLIFTTGIVLVDHLLLLPEITNLWTGLLVIPAFALRAVGFLTTAVLMAFMIKLTEESSYLSADPDKIVDISGEKTVDELWKEDNDGKSMAQSAFSLVKETFREDQRH